MSKYRFLALTLVVILAAGTLTLSTTATSPKIRTYNQEVDAYRYRIEERFDVLVEFPQRQDGYYAIGTATLATLETTLGYLSPHFVQELSAYYHTTYGHPLTFEFGYLPGDLRQRDVAALGYFHSDSSTIRLFIPTNGTQMTMSGSSPFTILHEVGHAYQLFLSNKLGNDRFINLWTALNAPHTYSPQMHNPDTFTFVSSYASLNYQEDFAETFAYFYGSNRDGLGIAHRFYDPSNNVTGLGRKIEFIQWSVSRYFGRTPELNRQYEKSLNAQPVLYYQQLPLSGNSLEYIAFNQPAGILDNILDNLKIQPMSTQWKWEVGGWKVEDYQGGQYLVFPGSTYVTLQIPQRKATP